MTLIVTVNNAAGWQTSHLYVVGDMVSHDNFPVKGYQCITAGTSASSGGPTGTGSSITDGTVIWKYLSGIDYTTWTAAIAGIGTISQPTIIEGYPGAEYVTTTAIVISNLNPSSYTLTLCAAPGFSFSDNTNNTTNPLCYNPANGVAIRCSTTGQNTFTVGISNVLLIGLQIAGSTPVLCNAALSITQSISSNGIFGCICLSTDSNGGLKVVRGVTRTTPVIVNVFDSSIVNSLLISASSPCSGIICQGFSFNNIYIENNTIISYSDVPQTGAGIVFTGLPVFSIHNNAIFNFSSAFSLPGSNSSSTLSNNASNNIVGYGTSNQDSKIFGNQFIGTSSTSPDFRLKTGSNLIATGTTAMISYDIINTVRPSPACIGAWELITITSSIYSTSISEIIYAVDTTNSFITFTCNINEILLSNETSSAQKILNVNVDEIEHIVDTLGRNVNYNVNVDEIEHIVDTLGRNVNYNVNVDEHVQICDKNLIISSITENLYISDTSDSSLIFNTDVTENISISDYVNATITNARSGRRGGKAVDDIRYHQPTINTTDTPAESIRQLLNNISSISTNPVESDLTNAEIAEQILDDGITEHILTNPVESDLTNAEIAEQILDDDITEHILTDTDHTSNEDITDINYISKLEADNAIKAEKLKNQIINEDLFLLGI